jgi:hypothetical protein
MVIITSRRLIGGFSPCLVEPQNAAQAGKHDSGSDDEGEHLRSREPMTSTRGVAARPSFNGDAEAALHFLGRQAETSKPIFNACPLAQACFPFWKLGCR